MREVFPIATVLAVYNNKPTVRFNEMCDLINYMTGHDVPLWEIPRARAMCATALARQFPWLEKHPIPMEFKPESANKFVRAIIAKVQIEEVAVPKLKRGAYRPLSYQQHRQGA